MHKSIRMLNSGCTPTVLTHAPRVQYRGAVFLLQRKSTEAPSKSGDRDCDTKRFGILKLLLNQKFQKKDFRNKSVHRDALVFAFCRSIVYPQALISAGYEEGKSGWQETAAGARLSKEGANEKRRGKRREENVRLIFFLHMLCLILAQSKPYNGVNLVLGHFGMHNQSRKMLLSIHDARSLTWQMQGYNDIYSP